MLIFYHPNIFTPVSYFPIETASEMQNINGFIYQFFIPQ